MQCTFRLYYLFHMNQAEKIMILNLSRNEMSCCAKLKELCQFLSNSQIISLDLSDNRINCDGVYYLAQVLQSTKISSLNLANNEISTNGVQHLVLKLPGSQLKSLDLSHNLITDESIECLCGNLAYTKYADLNLRGNKIGRQAVDHLCKNVAEINVQFDLPNDDFSHHIDLCKYPGCVIEIYQTSFEKGIDYFNKFVCDKTDITKVYIRSSCKNGLPFFRDLAKIVSNINISEIEMGEYSRIPYSVFANIAQLKCNGTGSWFSPVVLNRVLIELKFQNIKKNCFQDLAKLCLNNIMYLDLSHIDLEEDKFIFFAQALKNNTMDQNKNNYLISLNLSNNKLGAKSAKLLAEVLPYNIPSLTYIDLNGNKIGYSGFKSLMEVVDKTSLCWLSLGDNNIEDQLQESIELSPYIVPRKDDETPVAFQVRYLFRQLVSMNTCSGELEFTIPTTDSNPPVNITHYPKLLKIYSAFENDVKYLNVQVYDNYYMKSKRHDRRLLEKIEKFGNEIEKRFLSFINSISNQTKLEQAFGYDSFVVLVRECERLELNECVESLLLHRVLYYVDDDEEILHPFIYRMMHKYSMPLYCKQIEPNKRKQIIAYYKNHPEIEEAEALIDLLASMSTEEN
ncbi:uncharacterized protein LOC111047625 [Nilaparvata lugens]|uniref:uncharacterized protein LOC111047625 n=1 Tax=Nilaparvata lugens TaxID=108931 RepID=UPI00193CE003|nr:uncharacterized protein LOC111047625 [Nilaparvata lugens]